MSSSVIYLWSQYSPVSAHYLAYIQERGGRTICVDHPKIRKQITQSAKINISEIPCILISSQGRMIQYEGGKAIQWIQYQQTKDSQPSYPPSRPQMGNPQMGTPQTGTPQSYPQQMGNPQSYPQQMGNSQSYPQQMGNPQSPNDMSFNMIQHSQPLQQQTQLPQEGTELSSGLGGVKFAVMISKQQDDNEGPAEPPIIEPRQMPLAKGAMMAPPTGYPQQGLQMGNLGPPGPPGPIGPPVPSSGGIPPGVTPISNIIPDNVLQPQQTQTQQMQQQSNFGQILGNYTQQAMEHYQQFQQAPPQVPQLPGRDLTPKEQEFQQVLNMARQTNNSQTEWGNQVIGSSS